MTGKIVMKNLIYDFSDPANHIITFRDSNRRLEGKSFFTFKSQTSEKGKGMVASNSRTQDSESTCEFI
jgi:hypothetical protein